MELVAPAGNIEKLRYVYEYGADAAYIGLKRFSLRVKADNFYEDEYKQINKLKKEYPNKKLFCALNISFHNHDIDQFISEIDYFKKYPIDSFIVQDIGIVPILQKHFPTVHLHLSTQANCINREAVKMYKNIGFKRIVLGREASLKEISEIKEAVPDIELEVFAHGAMCISYSGRCLLSAYMSGRSANGGFCSQSCRWNWKLHTKNKRTPTNSDFKKVAESGDLVLEEEKRQGEYYPVFEGDSFTAVLSSKDLCMVHHLDDMKKAGVDSLKIEGRMKSLYYAAMTTRAYRKAIDAVEGNISQTEADPYIEELYKTQHRKFATGFFYSRVNADKTTCGESSGEYDVIATVGSVLSERKTKIILQQGATTVKAFFEHFNNLHPKARDAKQKDLETHPEKAPRACELKNNFKLYPLEARNKFSTPAELEYVGPDTLGIKDKEYVLIDIETGCIRNWMSHGNNCYLYTDKPIKKGWILRTRTQHKKNLGSR
ncbi:MAG TPA: peptidase U32 family protein [Treponemataceae bacterium]|nr:peptidase U32 family protein [Treponemataceae bacterium]